MAAKFQVTLLRKKGMTRIIVQTPHGRKWVTAHVHDLILDSRVERSVQLQAALTTALFDAGVTEVDVTL